MYSKYTLETIFAKNVSMVSRVFLMNASKPGMNSLNYPAYDLVLSTNDQLGLYPGYRILLCQAWRSLVWLSPKNRMPTESMEIVVCSKVLFVALVTKKELPILRSVYIKPRLRTSHCEHLGSMLHYDFLGSASRA